MQTHKDNFSYSDSNAFFDLSVLSVLGDREEQQDSCGFELKTDEGFVIVCDGMGGHEGGGVASTIAVDVALKSYCETYPCCDINEMLLDIAESADQKVVELKKADGTPMHSGSTMVAVVIRQNKLNWISVGDSRIYLFRDDDLVRATTDHTYQLLLNEKKSSGEITDDIYHTESIKGEALISFIGAGGLPRIDMNDKEFNLKSNDRILLTSDGLYKRISDEEIKTILSNFNNIEDALKALELKVQKKAKNKSRDNMTVALIKVK